nr:hypothetical protein [Tanacetum cinerariifolium]
MNQSCDIKGIKREFSVARTPQQNGVAERKNRTLIEAARTMLVDSKLPTTFWTEAVNTACYVLNRALVVKPHYKTPYELIRGRPPLIDFIKPFGCQVEKKKEPEQEYILIPICTNDPLISQGPKDSAVDAGKKATKVDESQVSDNGRQDDQVTRSEFKGLLQQERQTEYINNIDSFNTVSSFVNTTGPSFVNATSPSPINAAGTPDSTNPFEEHPFERFFPFKNAFSLPHVPIVTPINDTGIFGNAYDDEAVEEKENKSQRLSKLSVCLLLISNGTQETSSTLKDPRWVEAMQDELLQFKLLKVCTLVDLPKDKWTIGTKWVFRNKKDERGIVIKEEVYTCQPPGFEDPNIPDKVYKVDKALYGLHQAPRACQEKYVAAILKKFDFIIVKTASTPTEPNKALVKDAEAEDVDVHLYRSMIGSLMYLTTSRPNITFAVCACARFQVTPNTSHLHVVKRIFRYLKGQPKLGLWKSTTGGCQFLGKMLISWQRKKQTIIANSTTKAEYVAAASCCGQVTKISQSSRPTNLVADETVYKEWEDRMEKAVTTASSLEAEQDSGNINRTQSMATLNEPLPQGTGSGSGLRCQVTILVGAEAQTRFEAASTQSNDPPLLRVHTLRIREDNIKLKGIDGILYKTV